ncbi:MAG: hypothetical protein AB9M60_24080, partial [Leptothrix sp. (in: b-proteobacteria)]
MRPCPTPHTPAPALTASVDTSIARQGQTRSSARLTVPLASLALAVAMLSACGGGDAGSAGTGSTSGISATQASALSVSDTQRGTVITLSATPNSTATTATASSARASSSAASSSGSADASDDSDHATSAHQTWSTSQYALSASIAVGPDAGQSVGGTLMLQGEVKSDGSTRLKGRFVPTPSAAATPPTTTTTTTANVTALRSNTTLVALQQQYRSHIDTLVAQLRSQIGSDGAQLNTPGGQQALASFRSAIDQSTAQLQSDSDDALTASQPGGATARALLGGKVSVSGTIGTDGSVNLKLAWRGHALTLTGTQAADGSLSGTFADSVTKDSGSWQAAPAGTAAPAPAPTPAPAPAPAPTPAPTPAPAPTPT